MSRSTLRAKARILLSIANSLKFSNRPNAQINLDEIERAARQWSRKKDPPRSKGPQEEFVSHAVAWLRFLGRLQMQNEPAKVYDQMLVEFKEFMEKDRGLSSVTTEHRCHFVRPFLDQLLSKHRSLDMISVADIDALLAQSVNEHHYARVSVRGYASYCGRFSGMPKCAAGVAEASPPQLWPLAFSSKKPSHPARPGKLSKKFSMPPLEINAR